MPYSTIADRMGSHYDTRLVIRPITAAPLAATASETAIAFPIRKNDITYVILQVRDITGTIDGTNNWTFTVEVSAVVGGPFTTLGSYTLTSNRANDYAISVSGYNVGKILPTAEFIRVTATKAGTAGALTYAAYLSPESP